MSAHKKSRGTLQSIQKNYSKNHVSLMASPLPFPFGWAIHLWFECGTRYEVREFKSSTGYVHTNILPFGVGMRRYFWSSRRSVGKRLHVFSGQDASRIIKTLRNYKKYPYSHIYRYFPGPNSNTFIAWVLNTSGVEYALAHNAFGARWKQCQHK